MVCATAMNATTEVQSPPHPTREPFQFSVAQFLICIACIGFFLCLVTSVGWRAAYLFSGVCGLTLIGFGLIKRRERYQGFGTIVAMASGFMYVGGTIGPPNNQSAVLVSCPIQVKDANGKPIRGATVRMQEVASAALPAANNSVISAATDSTGTAWLTYSFRFTSIRGWFSERPYLDIPASLSIQVDAAGYQPTSVRLETITGADYDWFDLPLPEITIQLEAINP